MSRDPSVFSRWSDRKRAVAAEAEAEAEAQAAIDAEAAAVAQAEKALDEDAPEVELTEQEVLEKLGLRDPDEMQQGDDFAAFLKEGVPEALKNRALRRLWRSNPVLANLDGMVDYGQDFTDAAMVPETMNTLYQVGKGMLRKIADDPVVKAESAEDATEVAPEAAKTNGINREPISTIEADETVKDQPEEDPQGSMKIAEEVIEIEEENDFKPRRMAFRRD